MLISKKSQIFTFHLSQYQSDQDRIQPWTLSPKPKLYYPILKRYLTEYIKENSKKRKKDFTQKKYYKFLLAAAFSPADFVSTSIFSTSWTIFLTMVMVIPAILTSLIPWPRVGSVFTPMRSCANRLRIQKRWNHCHWDKCQNNSQ